MIVIVVVVVVVVVVVTLLYFSWAGGRGVAWIRQIFLCVHKVSSSTREGTSRLISLLLFPFCSVQC